MLLFHDWAQHYARVIGGTEVQPIGRQSVGLIKDIMVTLDSTCVDHDLLERAQSGVSDWSTAEILRAWASTLLATDCPVKAATAETVLLKALNVAKTQGALAWSCVAPPRWRNCGSVRDTAKGRMTCWPRSTSATPKVSPRPT